MTVEWLTFDGWTSVHQVAPAGGSGKWRTTCGRTTPKQPAPAAEGTPRCAMCKEGSGERGYQRHRPVIRGAGR